MGKIDLISKQWCDLIFEGRNKDYGAYKIRNESGRRNLIAFTCVILLMLSPLLYLSVVTLLSYSQNIDFKNVTEISNLKPAENKHRVAKKVLEEGHDGAKKDGEKKSEELLIKADRDVPDETANAKSGQENATQTVTIPADTTALDDKVVDHNAVNANIDTKLFRIIEELPEFPGGASAFMKWLTHNLKYPKSMDEGEDGEVVVQFIVNKNGTISDLKIIKSLNEDCDREVMRVFRMMPKWKPGIENGKPTRTQYVVPVVFRNG
jgi:protein TonB